MTTMRLDCWSNAAAASGSICGIAWRITSTGRGEYRLTVGGEYLGSYGTYYAAAAARNRSAINLSQDSAKEQV